jgi:hypothetical protein
VADHDRDNLLVRSKARRQGSCAKPFNSVWSGPSSYPGDEPWVLV